MAYVRHRQGLRLARRPGRDRIYGARGARRGLRTRARRRAVQPQRRRHHLSAPVRRPYAEYGRRRSEEHTSELQSLMRISYAVFCLKKKTQTKDKTNTQPTAKTHIRFITTV